jgi:hypothetical protein
MPREITKAPAAVLDYHIDWTEYLGDSGDTIVASTWTVPTGLVKETDIFTTTRTSIVLSGGTTGVSYTVTNKVQLSGPAPYRYDVRSLIIKVQSR